MVKKVIDGDRIVKSEGRTDEERSKVFRFNVDHENCGCCNWEVNRLYVLAASEKEAKHLLEEGLAGLCGDCFSDLLTEGEYVITKQN